MTELIDAAENVLIAYAMGWDLDGVMARLQEMLEKERHKSDTEPEKDSATD